MIRRQALLLVGILGLSSALSAQTDPFFPQQSSIDTGALAQSRYRLMGVMVQERGGRLVLVEQRLATAGQSVEEAARWWLLRIGEPLPRTGWTVAGIDGRGAIFARDGGRHIYRYPGQGVPVAGQ